MKWDMRAENLKQAFKHKTIHDLLYYSHHAKTQIHQYMLSDAYDAYDAYDIQIFDNY